MSGVIGQCGGCQCGLIRYRLDAEARMLYACHCSDCRKQSASAFGLSLIVDAAALQFTAGEDLLQYWDTRGDDGEIKRCAFCPRCGTRLYHGSDDPAAAVSVKGGTLDDPSRLRPVAHIWLDSALPWVRVDPAEFACFPREPEDEAKLERRWREQIARD